MAARRSSATGSRSIRATVVDTDGVRLGEVESIELVTIGQRKGIGLPGGGPKRYVVDVDTASATVIVGGDVDLLRAGMFVDAVTWVDEPVDGPVLVQCSAHGEPRPATIEREDAGVVSVTWHEPERRIAPGQSVVLLRPRRHPGARRRHRPLSTPHSAENVWQCAVSAQRHAVFGAQGEDRSADGEAAADAAARAAPGRLGATRKPGGGSLDRSVPSA